MILPLRTPRNAKKKTKDLTEIMRYFAEGRTKPCETLFSFPV